MPTVVKIKCDASEYAQELTKAIAMSREAAAQIGKLAVDGRGAEITVDANVEQIAEAVEQITDLESHSGESVSVTVDADAGSAAAAAAQAADLESHDGESVSITIDVKQTGSDLQTVNRELSNVQQKTITIPPSNFFTHMGGTIRETWHALTDFHGGAKKLIALIGAGGGAVGVIAAGIASVGKIVSWVADQFRKEKEESAQLLQSNAQSIREAAERNAALRQETDGYMSKLSQLASAEKLSNAEKAEALQLINDLSKGYGDLGIRVDSATGKITGFDKAMKEKSRRDREQRLAELKAEEAQLRASYKNWGEIGDSAGIPTGFGNWRIGGGDVAARASLRQDEIQNRLQAVMRERAKILAATPKEDVYERQREAALKDAEKGAADAAKKRREERESVLYDRLMQSGSYTGAVEVAQRSRKQAEQDAAKIGKKIIELDSSTDWVKDADDAREKTMQILALREKFNAAREKSVLLAEKEAAALQQLRNMQGTGKEAAMDLAWAVEDKRRKLGPGDERGELVRRLAGLEWDMGHDQSRELANRADLSIKTDALTRRGGFRNGAVAPDADKWDRLQSELQKKQVDRLNEIGDNVKKLMELGYGE